MLFWYLVASLEVPEDGAIVEEGEVGHVLALLELGRVDLPQLGRLELLLLQNICQNIFETSLKTAFFPNNV
jgi:hypothetical protein